MKFEIFRKKEEKEKINCFDITIDDNNKICYLEVKTIVVSRSKAVEKLDKSRDTLLKLEEANKQGYTIKIVEKNPKMPNEYIISNKSLYEYLMSNKDFTETIFGSRGR